MADNGPSLVTGAAGQLGALGRTVTGLLLERGLPVRAMVRREDDRAAALRAAGAEVVVGDLLENRPTARPRFRWLSGRSRTNAARGS
jgi:NAD(P)H dehydrogenase (quinone)